jgi:hypothetical protein
MRSEIATTIRAHLLVMIPANLRPRIIIGIVKTSIAVAIPAAIMNTGLGVLMIASATSAMQRGILILVIGGMMESVAMIFMLQQTLALQSMVVVAKVTVTWALASIKSIARNKCISRISCSLIWHCGRWFVELCRYREICKTSRDKKCRKRHNTRSKTCVERFTTLMRKTPSLTSSCLWQGQPCR